MNAAPRGTTCPRCGTALPDGARFCPKDGTTVRDDTVMPMPSPVVSGVAQAGVSGSAPTAALPDNNDQALIGAVIDGRYRVRRRLGAGGLGAVFEAEHVEIKKPVAIKVMHAIFGFSDEFRARFEREARAASRLSHPVCVQVLDFGRLDRVEGGSGSIESWAGMPYLVLELVRGRPLIDRLEDGPPLSTAEVIELGRGLLAGLRHAHQAGIVHRDVKPANVMLTSGLATGAPATAEDAGLYRVKLLDFGLAKQMDDDGSAALTQAGMVFGTPAYLSPEQAAGGAADARSDLYAVGVLLYECFCGRRPFERDEPMDLVRDHVVTPPPPPRGFAPGMSEALEAILLRALAKEPSLRFQTAAELEEALAATPEARGGGLARPTTHHRARHESGASPPSAPPRSDAVATRAERRTPSAAAPPSPRTAAATPGASLVAKLSTLLATRRGPLPTWGWIAGGAGALLVVVVLALALRGGGAGAPSLAAAAEGPAVVRPPAAVLSETAAHALALVDEGRADEAGRVARAALARSPCDGSLRLALAAAYQRKLWCSDALEELERALRDEPALATLPAATTPALGCMGPKTRDKASAYLKSVDRLKGIP